MMEQALIEYLANASWQVLLLAAGAWLLLRIVRPEPLVQHRVWLAVLGLAVLLPLRGTSYGTGHDDRAGWSCCCGDADEHVFSGCVFGRGV